MLEGIRTYLLLRYLELLLILHVYQLRFADLLRVSIVCIWRCCHKMVIISRRSSGFGRRAKFQNFIHFFRLIYHKIRFKIVNNFAGYFSWNWRQSLDLRLPCKAFLGEKMRRICGVISLPGAASIFRNFDTLTVFLLVVRIICDLISLIAFFADAWWWRELERSIIALVIIFGLACNIFLNVLGVF